MQKSIQALVKWLYLHGAIEEKDQELYEYAATVFLITITPLVIVIAIGAVTDLIVEEILLMIPFFAIRKFSGGIHAKHAGTCFVLSILTLVICADITLYCKVGWILNIVLSAACFGLFLLSPIDSASRRLDVYERPKYKLYASIFTGICVAFYIGLWISGQEHYAVCIAFGVILAAVLQFLCFMQKKINKRDCL